MTGTCDLMHKIEQMVLLLKPQPYGVQKPGDPGNPTKSWRFSTHSDGFLEITPDLVAISHNWMVSHHNGDFFGHTEVPLTPMEANKKLEGVANSLRESLKKQVAKEIIEEQVETRLRSLGV